MKTLSCTYAMLKSYESARTNKWLALSEFIDNSISSWIGNDSNNDVDGLEISIIFDGSIRNNRKLFIFDNAKGMDEKILEEAMQPSDKAGEKSDKKLNQYGIGMKLGIFWYGEDCIVYSKKMISGEYFVEVRTSFHNSSDEVVVEAKQSLSNSVKYESGTSIIIEKIYDNKWLNSSEELSEIEKALGWRYRKFLEDKDNGKKGMKITLEQIVKDNKSKLGAISVKPFSVKPFTLESFKNYYKNKKNFDYDGFLKAYPKDIERKIKENSDNNLFTVFCKKLVNNEPLESSIKIKWEGFEDLGPTLFFGIVNSTYEKKLFNINGVTTFHLNRAIDHGPNTRNNNSCIQFNEWKSGSESSWRRLFGEIDLTNYEKPDQNKSSFNWTANGRNNLIRELYNIWDSLKDFLQLIIDWERTFTKTEKISEKEKKEVIKYSNNSIDISQVISDIGFCEITNEDEFYYHIKEIDKKIWIIEKDIGDFIRFALKNEKNIYVFFNANHKFWKPFIDDENNLEYRGNSLYPLILLITLCATYLNKKNHYNGGFLKINSDTDYDFQEIINLVVRTIEAKNEK